MFGAGGEPTSVTLKWAVRFLATNPEVQRRAQEEISRAVGQDRAVAPSDRHDLPYVHALVGNFPHTSVSHLVMSGNFCERSNTGWQVTS